MSKKARGENRGIDCRAKILALECGLFGGIQAKDKARCEYQVYSKLEGALLNRDYTYASSIVASTD